jgi:hypothetical protein
LVAIRNVSSAAGRPDSPGMSKIHRSVTPSSFSAAVRASSIASQNASAAMPRSTDVCGVTVSSEYRMFCAAISRAIS